LFSFCLIFKVNERIQSSMHLLPLPAYKDFLFDDRSRSRGTTETNQMNERFEKINKRKRKMNIVDLIKYRSRSVPKWADFNHKGKILLGWKFFLLWICTSTRPRKLNNKTRDLQMAFDKRRIKEQLTFHSCSFHVAPLTV
jgi:hypothetical protein